jgi:glycosyltransferase involved in cell wall biosynthesis
MPERLRICVIGPMLGLQPARPISQGEILASFLANEGHLVTKASHRSSRLGRLSDMVATVLKNGRSTDVLCLQVYSGLSFVVEDIISLIGTRLGIPVVMHLHGGGFPEFIARHRQWTVRVLQRGTAMVAPSAFLARTAESLGLACRVIPNIIDPDAYVFRQRRAIRPRLLWMRTFDPEYNPEMAIRVLALVRQWAPDATLVMAGAKGSAERAARQLANELGVESATRFVGFLDLDGKNREGSCADIFLNTNHVDNTPVSVIEACAMGLPVVSTNVGGIGDLLTHEETGMLTEPRNVEAMADAVRRLCADADLVTRLSRGGRALAHRFSWTVAADGWNDVLRSAMAPSGAERARRVA